ncbi:MAG: M56 family metallopeptidase [Rhodothermales bacterium]
MQSFLEQLPPSLIDAAGAALLHFVWQGALVAIGLAIALRLMRHASAETRYSLCVGAAMLLLLLPVATAIQVYVAPARIDAGGWMGPVDGFGIDAASDDTVPSEPASVAKYAGPGRVESKIDGWDVFRWFALQWRWVIFRVWLQALPLFVLRLAYGMYGVGRLRRLSVPVEDGAWPDRFAALKAKMGISRPLRLVTSESVAQPALLGWLRPMIVVPAGLFAGIPAAHVEALLVHELAHIRRHDYLVVYLQAVLETLFFYHPAVWWVSRRLRIEREFACDAAAVRALGDDLTYVRALAGLEERRGPALALGASDGRLVDRIRRIVEGDTPRRTRMRAPSWALATVAVLAAGVFFAACGRTTDAPIVGTPDELFIQAAQLVKEGDFYRAKQVAEQSAEAGNLCSMQLLAELLAGDASNRIWGGEAFQTGMPWLGQDAAASKAWADRLEQTLHERAEAGDGDAMLWLSARYSSRWGFYPMWMDGQDDGLSRLWSDRALEVGHPIARRSHALQLAWDGQLAEADAILEELGRQGDAYAYWRWAMVYMDTRRDRVDPERHFAVASLAVDNEAAGLHEWLGKELQELQEQAAQGNRDAIAYLEVANRFDLIHRMTAMPEKAWHPGDYVLPPLCDGQRTVRAMQSASQ